MVCDCGVTVYGMSAPCTWLLAAIWKCTQPPVCIEEEAEEEDDTAMLIGIALGGLACLLLVCCLVFYTCCDQEANGPDAALDRLVRATSYT